MDSREHIEQAAATWIARRDAGPWTEADDVELTAWLAASFGHRAAFYRLNSAWQEAGRLQALHAAHPQGSGPAQRKGAREGRVRLYALAASLLFAVAMGSVRYFWPAGPSYRTEVGGLEAVPLSDGSKVTLNTDSEIRVAVTETERRIDLERGEAFFEVAADPARPFVVQAGNKRVIAVGTKFSVRHEGDDLRVVVSEGRVRVETSRREAVAELAAGTIARARDGGLLVVEHRVAEIERSLSWRSGQLTFRDTPLADAVAEFNRYNTRKIVIEDPTVAALEVGGIFRATEVDPFVRLIQEAFPIQVAQTEDKIILSAAADRR